MERPTYHATATYDGKWWAVIFDDLPPGYGGATQGRTLEEAQSMAEEAIALTLDIEEGTFDVILREGPTPTQP